MTEYVIGCCRNDPDKARTHLYAKTEDGLLPMCGYGWNRSDGEAFSILRGNHGGRGRCRICEKRRKMECEPIKDGWPHKTKWI